MRKKVTAATAMITGMTHRTLGTRIRASVNPQVQRRYLADESNIKSLGSPCHAARPEALIPLRRP